MNGLYRVALALGVFVVATSWNAPVLPDASAHPTMVAVSPIHPSLLKSVGTVTQAGEMLVPRAAHALTVLPNGQVLITGGIERDGVVLSSAELYDPATGTFTPTGDMTSKRTDHAAILLADGTVLVVGGFGTRVLASAEIYDPTAGTFTATGSMSVARDGFTATLLQDGRVLIAGGNARANYASAELYDPATGVFTPTGDMTSPRTAHTATLLSDGRVLITGGSSAGESHVVASAELYDPSTGTFTPTGNMSVARHKHAAILLADGQVLIVGGADGRDWQGRYQSTEIYDPAEGTFSPADNMNDPRFKLFASVASLDNGNVLIAGGSPEVEVYDSATGQFATATGQLDASRFFMVATRLPDGQVLITGGYDYSIQATAKVWLFTPGP